MNNLKDIFITNHEPHKNAYLNWRFNKEDSNEEKFSELGDAYFEVATHLINICIQDNINSKLDGWIFPILFDIYQGLELYLKAYNHYLNSQKSIKSGGHDIRSISGEIFNKLMELKTNNKDNKEIEEIFEEYKIIRKFVKMMYDNTTTDVSFVRYPLNNKMEDFFYIEGNKTINENGNFYIDNVTIDIERLNDWINCIHPILEKHIYYWDYRKNPEKYL